MKIAATLFLILPSSTLPSPPQLLPSRRLADTFESNAELECEGKMKELKVCNSQLCPTSSENAPVDGAWGSWSYWGVCSCTGVKERHRLIVQHSKFGGKVVEGPEVQAAPCTPECEKTLPKDCSLGLWSDWSACDKNCGGGQQFRERGITSKTENCGKTCKADLKDTRSCNSNACVDKSDCQVSEWETWSSCDKDCGGGQQFRTREVLNQASHGGAGCSTELVQAQGCNTECCYDAYPLDCKWGDWNDWSACSVSCDGGEMTRDRSIKVAPRNGGAWCDPSNVMEVAACGMGPCDAKAPVDGLWSEWSEWSSCTVSCGGGYQFRNRDIARQAKNFGNPVTGDLQEYRGCNTMQCGETSSDCAFSQWSEWSDCSCPCNGHKERSRRITNFAKDGGMQCSGALRQINSCNVESSECSANQAIDCQFSEWSYWSQCTVSCDGGDRYRERHIAVSAEHQGLPCQGETKQIEPCNLQHCCPECDADRDCKWSSWEEWSACSVDCGGGQMTRYRHIDEQPKNGGLACEVKDSVEVTQCNTQRCGTAKFCVWGDWSAWGYCNADCGGGQQEREKFLTVTDAVPENGDSLATAMLFIDSNENRWYYMNLLNLASTFVGAILVGAVMAAVLWNRKASPIHTREARAETLLPGMRME